MKLILALFACALVGCCTQEPQRYRYTSQGIWTVRTDLATGKVDITRGGGWAPLVSNSSAEPEQERKPNVFDDIAPPK